MERVKKSRKIVANSMSAYSTQMTKIQQARVALQRSREQQQLWSKPPRATLLQPAKGLAPITQGIPSSLLRNKRLSLPGEQVPGNSSILKSSQLSHDKVPPYRLKAQGDATWTRNDGDSHWTVTSENGPIKRVPILRINKDNVVFPAVRQLNQDPLNHISESMLIESERSVYENSVIDRVQKENYHSGLPKELNVEKNTENTRSKVFLHVSLPSMFVNEFKETTVQELGKEEGKFKLSRGLENDISLKKATNIPKDDTLHNISIELPKLSGKNPKVLKNASGFGESIKHEDKISEEVETEESAPKILPPVKTKKDLPVLEIKIEGKLRDKCRSCPACVAELQQKALSVNGQTDNFRKRKAKIKRNDDVTLNRRELHLGNVSYHKSFTVNKVASHEKMDRILKNALDRISKERQQKERENKKVKEQRRQELRNNREFKQLPTDSRKVGPIRVLCRHGKFVSDCHTCSAVEEVRRRLKYDISQARQEYEWKFGQASLSNRWRSSQNTLNPFTIDEILHDLKKTEKSELVRKTVQFSDKDIVHPLIS